MLGTRNPQGLFFARLDPRGEKAQSECWWSAVLEGCMHICAEMLDVAAVKNCCQVAYHSILRGEINGPLASKN